MLTLKALKALKAIPDRSNHATFGYVREMEKGLMIQNVPVMICYYILGYYHHGEYFCKAGQCLGLSQNGMSVTRTKQLTGLNAWKAMALGKIPIKLKANNMIRWSFKIDSFGDFDKRNSESSNILLGLVSKNRTEKASVWTANNAQVRMAMSMTVTNAKDFDLVETCSFDQKKVCLFTNKQYDYIIDTLNWNIMIKRCDKVIVCRKILNIYWELGSAVANTEHLFGIWIGTSGARFTLIDVCIDDCGE